MVSGLNVLAHPLCDVSDVLSVFPAGKHVSESKRLKSCMDQVWFGSFFLIFFYEKKKKTKRKSDAIACFFFILSEY